MRAHSSLLYRVVAVVLCVLLSPLPILSQGSSSSQAAGQITALVPQTTRNGALARAKEEVNWNDVLRTEGAGRARVQLRDGSILSLGSNSELKITQHDPATQQTEVELNYGRVRSRVVQITKPGGKFQVKTPTAVAGVVGTDYIVVYEGGNMQVIVFSGQVVIISATGQVLATVNAGQMVTINPDGTVTGPSDTPPGVQQDNINQTNAGNGTTGGAAGTGGNLLRTVLIILGVAAASAIITTTTGKPAELPPTPTPTPTPTPDGTLPR